jgi:hypothetical protein
VVVVDGADGSSNTAFVEVSCASVSLHVACCPAQAPVQALKTAPGSGLAVSVTAAWSARPVAVHVTPQAIPAGSLVTVPVPSPLLVTVRASPTNLRPMSCLEQNGSVGQMPLTSNVVVHGSAGEGAVHPNRICVPGSGVTVSVTEMLGRIDLKIAWQVDFPSGRPSTNRQSIPAGELVTLRPPSRSL